MTEQELNLSNLSYVNKDFRSIYPDLLDLVKTLTNRWDPSSSNESDPGVVLLKVGAFLADHLNYNIDKNILEAFLPSATQEESVRKIAEFGGYTPRYYRSAVGNVSVAYNPDEFIGGFSIPQFTLVISNEDGSITYTQLDPITIIEKGVPDTTRRFIEGTIQRLVVDSPIITMNNLDDFRRVYFPNQYIAENGIFIYNVDETGKRSIEYGEWTKTDYIYTQPIGTRCYKVDFDSSKNLPYIEFPSDIANLIGNGLAIFYIYTSGSYGNVKAGELNTVVSINSANMPNTEPATIAAQDADSFTISNKSSITNGCEPETINEIYDSYKKVVGTFDTLVSTQDYSNAIRMIENNEGERYVSNGLVTDRRIDYNNALNVLSSKMTGTYFTNVALNFGNLTFAGISNGAPANAKKGTVFTQNGAGDPDFEDQKTYLCTDDSDPSDLVWKQVESVNSTELEGYLDGMTPYDLIIYALQKYSETDYNSIYYWRALENSFKQIDGDATIGGNVVGTEDNLIRDLEEYKCINHTFTDLKNGQVYCFKNKVPLNVDIVPYNKVTRYERAEILDNIRRAISNNFNASKVEFGVELNYDTVKKVIEESDARINYVRLSDFDYRTKAMIKVSDNQLEAQEYDLTDPYDGTTFLVDLAAKNVIAGRLCLFNFDNNFNYRFGQSDCEVFKNITSVKSTLTIEPSTVGTPNEYNDTLSQNEYLEIYYPNYYSDKTYGSYVLYNFTHTGNAIPAGSDYTLVSGDELKIWYKDSYGNIETPVYTAGTVIQASFDLDDFNDDTGRPTYTKDGTNYKQISSNESISTRVLLDVVLNTPTYVYWILNNENNILFESGETEKILSSGEYFIYTDSTKSDLIIYGRGTHLKRTDGVDVWELPLSINTKVSPSQFNEDGLASKIPFINNIQFNNNNLTITEMNIVTLGEGDSFKLKSNAPELNGIEVSTEDGEEIEYTVNGNTHKLPAQTDSDFYKVRTRLDINASRNSPMILNNRQEIEITSDTGTSIITNKYIQSNISMNLSGSSDEAIDLSTYGDLGLSVNWLTYSSDENIDYIYPLTDTALNVEIPFSTIWYDTSEGADRKYIIQVFLSNENLNDGKVEVRFTDDSDNPVDLGYLGNIDSDGGFYCLNNKSIYIYPIVTSASGNNYKLKISAPIIADAIVTIVDPKVVWGVNNDLATSESDVISRIDDLLSNSSIDDVQFHWTSIPKLDLAMNTTDLTDPYSMFDHNNVANIITIPEIDLKNSNLEIVRSMRNY